MSVLTLAGKKIDWAHPPKATDMVSWSQSDINGRKVTGSLRTIAHLDHLDALAKKKFGSGVVVMQPPFNKGVPQSEGTHDYDACLDGFIPNVPWDTQQSFFRANGAGAYYRRPPSFTSHIHWFVLPPRSGGGVALDYMAGGFRVGKYVDGGYSVIGKRVGSAQIEDYYDHKDALVGHAPDPSWFPPNIEATIFDLRAYVLRQRFATRLAVAVINIPNKVGRADWITCWEKAAARSAVFGVNESFHKAQRETYAHLLGDDFAQFGLHTTPNPVFWRKVRFSLVRGMVHEIHPKNTEAPNHAKWPGFYDARFITEVVLRQRTDGQEFAILNTHLAAGVKVIDQRWLRRVRRASKRALRDLVRKHQAAGRVVIVMGDTNMVENFAMPRGFRWLVQSGIDKIGANRNGRARLFTAPTDHKHGVAAVVWL